MPKPNSRKKLILPTEKDVIKDTGIHLVRTGLEAVQYTAPDVTWHKLARSAQEWKYDSVQMSAFQLDPKALVETDLAEVVLQYFDSLTGGDGLPMALSGLSTHCQLITWGYPQHPGVLNFVPADDNVKKKLAGKPEAIREWMWEHVVQYIPEATAKLNLTGTHTFVPPATIGDIPGLEYSGAVLASYPFVQTDGVQALRDDKLVEVNLWQEALEYLNERLGPLYDLLEKHKVELYHEKHWDTFARGSQEFNTARRIMGKRAGKHIKIGEDSSHSWGEDWKAWIDKTAEDVRNLHIKPKVQYGDQPLITGEGNWFNRGMRFGNAGEGQNMDEYINYVLATTGLARHKTHRDQKAIGTIGGKKVFQVYLISEGEHAIVTQPSVAIDMSAALRPFANRKYGEPFKVGGAKG